MFLLWNSYGYRDLELLLTQAVRESYDPLA